MHIKQKGERSRNAAAHTTQETQAGSRRETSMNTALVLLLLVVVLLSFEITRGDTSLL